MHASHELLRCQFIHTKKRFIIFHLPEKNVFSCLGAHHMTSIVSRKKKQYFRNAFLKRFRLFSYDNGFKCDDRLGRIMSLNLSRNFLRPSFDYQQRVRKKSSLQKINEQQTDE